MVNTRVKDKLAAGQPATVIAPFASSAGLVELLGHMGFDGVFLDTEHGPAGWEDIEHMARAADLTGYSSVMRVQDNDALRIAAITAGTILMTTLLALLLVWLVYGPAWRTWLD